MLIEHCSTTHQLYHQKNVWNTILVIFKHLLANTISKVIILIWGQPKKRLKNVR